MKTALVSVSDTASNDVLDGKPEYARGPVRLQGPTSVGAKGAPDDGSEQSVVKYNPTRKSFAGAMVHDSLLVSFTNFTGVMPVKAVHVVVTGVEYTGPDVHDPSAVAYKTNVALTPAVHELSARPFGPPEVEQTSVYAYKYMKKSVQAASL